MNTTTTATTMNTNLPKKKMNKQHKEFRNMRKNPGKKQWQSI